MNVVRRALGRLPRSTAEIGWVVAGQCVAALCALVGVRYLTQLLSPAEYGVLALALTVGALMQQLVFGPVSSAVLRFYAASDERGELRLMLRAAGGLIGKATLVLVACALLALLLPVHALLGVGATVIALAALYACLSGVNGALSAAHSAARRRSVVAAHQALGEALRFTFAVIAIRVAAPTSAAALAGFMIGIGISSASQGVLLWRAVRTRGGELAAPTAVSAPWGLRLLDYARPFALWGGFTWAVLAADRWSLQVFHSTSDVGRYAALFQLGSYPVTMGATMMVQLVAPILFARAADGTDAARRGQSRRLNLQLTMLVMGATVVATLLAAMLHRQVFGLLVGEAYRSVSWLLPIVVFGSGVFAAGQQLALTLLSDLRVNRLITPKVGSALAGIACYYVGSRWWGITGVVVAGVAFAIIHLVWIALASRNTVDAPATSIAEPQTVTAS